MNVLKLEISVSDANDARIPAEKLLDALPKQPEGVSIAAILEATIMVNGKNIGTAWISPSALRRQGVVGIAKPNDKGGYDYLVCSIPPHKIGTERKTHSFADATNWIGCLYHANENFLHLSGVPATREDIRGTIFLPDNNSLNMLPFISGVVERDLKAIKFGARKLGTDIVCHLGKDNIMVVSSAKNGLFPARSLWKKEVVVGDISKSGTIIGEAVLTLPQGR